MDWHQGPRIDKIPVRGGVGAIFTIGVVLSFVFGVPRGHWFLLFALVAGTFIACGLFIWHKPKLVEIDDIDADLR